MWRTGSWRRKGYHAIRYASKGELKWVSPGPQGVILKKNLVGMYAPGGGHGITGDKIIKSRVP
jgi:hypothetical protein